MEILKIESERGRIGPGWAVENKELISKWELNMTETEPLFSITNDQSVTNQKLLDKMQAHKIPGVGIALTLLPLCLTKLFTRG